LAAPHYDEPMSFSETIFLFFLALIIFGPKKLPEIAKQAGRLLAELRRASNEFRSQIETEIAHLEIEKKQTVLPPSEPPAGAVASLNPAPSEVIAHDSSAALAAPTETAPAGSHEAAENLPIPSSAAAVPDAAVVPAPQDSHA
jgi:Sec-independent protein translocase protein TatA